MELFVYGTLMSPKVMNAVCGHRQHGEPAIAAGFKRRKLSREAYPAIVPDASELVEGVLYRDLDNAQLVLLDHFEGEYYQRRPITVSCADTVVQAQSYVLSPAYSYLLGNQHWDLDRFMAEGLHELLADYPELADIG